MKLVRKAPRAMLVTKSVRNVNSNAKDASYPPVHRYWVSAKKRKRPWRRQAQTPESTNAPTRRVCRIRRRSRAASREVTETENSRRFHHQVPRIFPPSEGRAAARRLQEPAGQPPEGARVPAPAHDVQAIDLHRPPLDRLSWLAPDSHLTRQSIPSGGRFSMMSSLLALMALAADPSTPATLHSRYAAPVEISVTDRAGTPLQSARVAVKGLSDREGTTSGAGRLVLDDLPAGIYALRAERGGFIPLEMKFTITGGEPVAVVAALSPLAAPTTTLAAAGAVPSIPSLATDHRGVAAGVGAPRILSIPDFAERQLIGHRAVQESPISGTGLASARLIQVREPVLEHAHADADEMLYVVAGDAILKIGDTEQRMSPGWFSTVPRETEHSLSRKGRNPAIILSMVVGQSCAEHDATR
ncbi:MAG: cupin domain-containing protein [Acidobacteria bacterium]|nr:cupin domain-containing protein [Acidobacteriota bacterium]